MKDYLYSLVVGTVVLIFCLLVVGFIVIIFALITLGAEQGNFLFFLAAFILASFSLGTLIWFFEYK